MKARVKATGEIVEMCNVEYDKEGNEYYRDELEFIDNYEPNYWKKLKHQYAGMAMQGLLAAYGVSEMKMCIKNGAEQSIRIATALVNKLKEEEK